jgi:hypothetical protein
LDAISTENKDTPPPSKISPALDSIRENFPNLKQETLEKLSTPEGMKNRREIINSLSDDELNLKINPVEEITTSIPLSKEKSNKIFNKIIKETMKSDSEEVIQKLKKEIANFDEVKYREDFMREVEADINSGRTEKERDDIRQAYLHVDLTELMKSADRIDSRSIKNIIRENYTYNNLMKEIKAKTNTTLTDLPTDLEKKNDTALKEVLNKMRTEKVESLNQLSR